MQKTYRENRGFHYILCQACGRVIRERIPDQACREMETGITETDQWRTREKRRPDGELEQVSRYRVLSRERWSRWAGGYRDNRGNPVLGLCPNCDHDVGLGGISLGPSSETGNGNGSEGTGPFDLRKHLRELPEGWRLWARIAYRFAPDEDTASHVIIKLAEMAERSPYPSLPKWLVYKVALWETTKYCRRQGRHRHKSLFEKVENNDGDDGLELQETIADDRAPDLDARMDARMQLQRLPRLPQKLTAIVGKRLSEERLSAGEWSYLYDWRNRLRNGLPTEGPQRAVACRCSRCGRSLGRSLSGGGNLQDYHRYQNLSQGWLRRHMKGCKGKAASGNQRS